jgi:hypothetical protein
VNLQVDEGRVHVTSGDNSAVYVGAGHQAVSNPQTGRTMGAAEMVREELSPPVAEAVAESITEPTAQDIVIQNNSILGIVW